MAPHSASVPSPASPAPHAHFHAHAHAHAHAPTLQGKYAQIRLPIQSIYALNTSCIHKKYVLIDQYLQFLIRKEYDEYVQLSVLWNHCQIML